MAAALAWAFLGCAESPAPITPPPPATPNPPAPTPAAARIWAMHPQYGRVDSKVTVHFIVYDAADKPIAGVDVKFTSDAGVLDSATVRTGAFGGASMGWTPPTTPGTYWLEASVGNVTQKFEAQISPGHPVQFALGTDSIAFTRRNTRQVRITARDKFGNPTGWTGLTATITGPFIVSAGTADSFPVVVKLESPRQTSGEVVFRRAATDDPTTPVMGRIGLSVDVPITSLTVTPNVHAQIGLAAGGASDNVTFVARDADNFVVPGTAKEIGVQFSSANSSIATVDSLGKVTGVAAGSTTVAAKLGTIESSWPVLVHPAYDFGALTTVYTGPYNLPSGPLVFENGRSFVSGFIYLTGPGCCTRYGAWYDAAGVQTASRAITSPMATSPKGHAVFGSPLTFFGVDGVEAWKKADVNATGVLLDSTMLVALLSPTQLRGYSLAGETLWNATLESNQRLVALAPERVYLTAADVGTAGSGTVHALSRAGAKLWSVAVPTAVHVPQTDEHSRLFVAYQSMVTSVDASGNVWSNNVDLFGARLAMAPGNHLVVVTKEHVRLWDRSSGAELWSTRLPFANPTNVAPGPPPVAAIGERVLVNGGGYVWVYRLSDGHFLGRTVTALSLSDAPRCVGGGLYIPGGGLWRYERCQ